MLVKVNVVSMIQPVEVETQRREVSVQTVNIYVLGERSYRLPQYQNTRKDPSKRNELYLSFIVDEL